jgi:hypothetical protein
VAGQWIEFVPQWNFTISARVPLVQVINDVVHIGQIHALLFAGLGVRDGADARDRHVKVGDAAKFDRLVVINVPLVLALSRTGEAPFPEGLPEFFIRTWCPRGGIVLDPFVGTGTTVAVARKWWRVGYGVDM